MNFEQFEFDCQKNQIYFGIAGNLRTNLYTENTLNRFELGFPSKIWGDFPNRRFWRVFNDMMELCYNCVTFTFKDWHTRAKLDVFGGTQTIIARNMIPPGWLHWNVTSHWISRGDLAGMAGAGLARTRNLPCYTVVDYYADKPSFQFKFLLNCFEVGMAWRTKLRRHFFFICLSLEDGITSRWLALRSLGNDKVNCCNNKPYAKMAAFILFFGSYLN